MVIPVLSDAGLDSQLSYHFGRAPYFAVVDVDDKGRVAGHTIMPNRSDHMGGIGNPVEIILKLNPDAVVTPGMGWRAINLFQQAKVAVLRAEANLVRDVIEAYSRGELEELTEGCLEHSHPLSVSEDWRTHPTA